MVESQVVDELMMTFMMTFTHDRQLDIMLPGIVPTRIQIAVVVVGFETPCSIRTGPRTSSSVSA